PPGTAVREPHRSRGSRSGGPGRARVESPNHVRQAPPALRHGRLLPRRASPAWVVARVLLASIPRPPARRSAWRAAASDLRLVRDGSDSGGAPRAPVAPPLPGGANRAALAGTRRDPPGNRDRHGARRPGLVLRPRRAGAIGAASLRGARGFRPLRRAHRHPARPPRPPPPGTEPAPRADRRHRSDGGTDRPKNDRQFRLRL